MDTKHLEFIQNVIARMNTNSFLVKGWMVTLVSALFALAAKDADVRFVIITYFAVPMFWLLDGYYISQERQYRDLYDDASIGKIANFSMDASPYNRGRNTWLRGIFSGTLLALYPPVIAITVVVMFWLCSHVPMPH